MLSPSRLAVLSYGRIKLIAELTANVCAFQSVRFGGHAEFRFTFAVVYSGVQWIYAFESRTLAAGRDRLIPARELFHARGDPHASLADSLRLTALTWSENLTFTGEHVPRNGSEGMPPPFSTNHFISFFFFSPSLR
jgi:hypothetical protein